MISLYGGYGFIGSHIRARSKFEYELMQKNARIPHSDESLYLISTTDNYNVFKDPSMDIKTNLIVLMETLRAHKPESTFNFISSWFVYGGSGGGLPFDEDSPCRPAGFYSITKLAAEQLLISYCKTFGINYRILRLANIYGPNDLKASQKKNALCWMIEQLKNDLSVSLYWGGSALRNYLHVYDLVDAIDLILEKAPLNITINVGAKDSVEYGSLIRLAKSYLNSRSDLLDILPSKFHEIVQVKDFRMNTTRLHNLGFEQKISIEEGIKDLCQRPRHMY